MTCMGLMHLNQEVVVAEVNNLAGSEDLTMISFKVAVEDSEEISQASTTEAVVKTWASASVTSVLTELRNYLKKSLDRSSVVVVKIIWVIGLVDKTTPETVIIKEDSSKIMASKGIITWTRSVRWV